MNLFGRQIDLSPGRLAMELNRQDIFEDFHDNGSYQSLMAQFYV